jgi:RHS repeat-associated protein
MHEHIDEMGIINMNGRIYDPLIGRFMSADPTIPHPYILQSFNRYSYVRNNPLKRTDPTGFDDGDGSDGSGHDGYSNTRVTTTTTTTTSSSQPAMLATVYVYATRDRCDYGGCSGSSGGSQGVPYPTSPGSQGGNRAPSSKPLATVTSVNVASGSLAVFGVDVFGLPRPSGVLKSVRNIGNEIGILSGILREARAVVGDLTLPGVVTRLDMDTIAKAWVGPGQRVTSDRSGLVSANGLMVCRYPAEKRSIYATTGEQANLERKLTPGSKYVSNAHINISR